MTTRCACTRPIADNAVICPRCAANLEQALAEVPALVGELETTRLRQSRTGGAATGVLSRSYDQPLPWDERAAEATSDMRLTMLLWVRITLEVRGTRPDYTPEAMSRFLLAHLEYLRHHERANDIVRQLVDCVEACTAAIDRAPDRLYAGPCDTTGEWHTDGQVPAELVGPCLTDLYAKEGKAEVICPRCAFAWRVQDRREHLLEAAQDRLVTAADLSRFLSAYGEPLTATRIKLWVFRGHLLAHGKTSEGRALYRVGDATDVLTRMAGKKREAA